MSRAAWDGLPAELKREEGGGRWIVDPENPDGERILAVVREADGREVAWMLPAESQDDRYQLMLDLAQRELDAARPAIGEVHELLVRLGTHLSPPIRRIPVDVPDTLRSEAEMRSKRRGVLE
ncbi:hypothetical protein [Roseisolibacter agri]|nr:hypothetical protein [Roseisolibacter agri]